MSRQRYYQVLLIGGAAATLGGAVRLQLAFMFIGLIAGLMGSAGLGIFPRKRLVSHEQQKRVHELSTYVNVGAPIAVVAGVPPRRERNGVRGGAWRGSRHRPRVLCLDVKDRAAMALRTGRHGSTQHRVSGKVPHRTSATFPTVRLAVSALRLDPAERKSDPQAALHYELLTTN